MFHDRARIHVQAGRGGDGSLHFRREKHVPKGGPDGGDGGPGGDVVLVADADLRDLSSFHARRWIKAGNGEPGRGVLKHGASVVNGYAATFGRAFEMRASRKDLPAFGSPTSAASASSFSRSSKSPSSPGSPTSAKRGTCRVGEAKRLFPRPAPPPRARTTRACGAARSAIS